MIMATNCMTLTSGICRGCRDNAGGVKTIYVADINDVVFPVTTYNGTVTNIELEELGAWYKLQPNKYSSNWVENIQMSVENGTLGYEQVVTAVFGKNSQELRDVINELAKGELVMLIVDNNNVMWMLGGKDNGVYVSGGNSASGQALSDLNGWNITFTCMSRDAAMTVVPATGSDLEAALEVADSAC